MKNQKKNKMNLIWIDLEMTGLDISKDKILEIATIITDINLNIISIGPNIVIFQKERILKNMNEWCKKNHKENGLLEKSIISSYDIKKAEKETLIFLKKWIFKKKSPMCGNSIYQDRIFLKKYMPTLESYFHYRNIDVSTIKELEKRWNPNYIKVLKKKTHNALSDLFESINELKIYKEKIWNL